MKPLFGPSADQTVALRTPIDRSTNWDPDPDETTMPLANCPTAEPPAAGDSRNALELRVRDGANGERRIALADGKHTVGSGPRCSLRFQRPGVRPLHCLLVRDADGLHVRRWAPETQLNGEPIDEADLAPGDTLSVGSVDLEVVGPAVDECAAEEIASSVPGRDDRRIAEQPPSTFHAPAEHWTGNPAEVPDLRSAARTRGRKLLAALRRQREEHRRLMERVGDLEQKIGCLLALPKGLPPADAGAAEPGREKESSSTTELPPFAEDAETEPGPDWLTNARAALARDRAPWERTFQTAECNETERLSSELSTARALLAEREEQLSELQTRLRNLEQQLLDSRRVMQCFADERSAWQKQMADVESRINGYLLRIQELEVQLVESRSADAAPPKTATNRSAEPELAAAAAMATQEPASRDPIDGPTTSDSGSAAAEPTAWDWQIDATEAPAASPTAEALAAAVATLPAASEPTAPSEADAALARLRELSIWRDEPVEVEENPAGSEPAIVGDETVTVGETASNEPTSQPSTSYIDRYAHLLDADEAGSDSPSTPPATEATMPPSSESAYTSADREHEESIEQYMAKLMERLRGSSVAEQEPPADGVAAVDDGMGVAAPDGEGEETNASLDAETLEPKPRVTPAERTTDMEALRALANQSARHAIGIHASRKLRRHARSKFVIALLAGLTGLFFALRAPRWYSLEFVTAVVAVVAALYWSQLMLRALLGAARVGALDKPEQEDFAAIGGRPSLPIDVRR